MLVLFRFIWFSICNVVLIVCVLKCLLILICVWYWACVVGRIKFRIGLVVLGELV